MRCDHDRRKRLSLIGITGMLVTFRPSCLSTVIITILMVTRDDVRACLNLWGKLFYNIECGVLRVRTFPTEVAQLVVVATHRRLYPARLLVYYSSTGGYSAPF